jgi:hypothetical protein
MHANLTERSTQSTNPPDALLEDFAEEEDDQQKSATKAKPSKPKGDAAAAATAAAATATIVSVTESGELTTVDVDHLFMWMHDDLPAVLGEHMRWQEVRVIHRRGRGVHND